ncbi:MAG: DUF547 domain-containing protein [Chitinophagaceae bacterium]|nr:DUF547 domain-containing protein [Chitinophagaceae bacterium]MBP7106945.1 DUF547 domain-containing protein [Chitinophagaceae bacterium]MBP7315890.1 DUF547 domain-containing protein [Chitinophagaceae bacterium]HQZ49069.1 DUF547 domain-containing protein [Chitinophagaceae bacterium]
MKVFAIAISLLFSSLAMSQSGYKVNDVTKNFQVNKILNYSASSSTFQQLNDKLLVVDFFGTWCIPCIRALPKLSALQEKYKGQINIVLVSDEPEEKLIAFIGKQKGFALPVIVDEQAMFTKLFQPPAYPYTAIVGKNGKVLAISAQEEMNEISIDKWLKEQESNNVMGMTKPDTDSAVTSSINIEKNIVEKSQNKLVQLSQDFMYAAKTGEQTTSFITSLKDLSMDELTATITNDNEKKAFWINLYNAYTNTALKNNPDQYSNRGKFFGNEFIEIAGKKFSLDGIEHGILRRSKIKWSLGYFNKLFPNKIEKRLRVDKLDYRLHFALNCGAKSCPPIAFYKSETIDQQLDLATKAYLTGEAEYDAATNIVKLPTLMSWFRRDFGGKKKMIELLKQLSIIPVDKNPKVKFKSYDWTLYLENYKL